MKTVYNPAVAKVTIGYDLMGVQLQNTLHLCYRIEPGVTASVLDRDMLTEMIEWIGRYWENEVMLLLSDALRMKEVRGVTLDPVLALEAVEVFDVLGGVGGGSAPLTVAIAARLSSPYRGKAYRGRLYLPGIPLVMISGNDISAQYQSDLDTALMGLASTENTTGPYLVVYSTIKNKIPRPVGTYAAVTDIYVPDTRLDTQAGRNPGR